MENSNLKNKDQWVAGWPVDPKAPQTTSYSTGPVKIQSRPVESVEGYLEGKVKNLDPYNYKPFLGVTKSDAIAALQALKADCDKEWFYEDTIKMWKDKAYDLTAEVERLKGLIEKHGIRHCKTCDSVWQGKERCPECFPL